MAENPLKKWLKENTKDTDTNGELSTNMKNEIISVDALTNDELEIFTKNKNNNVIIISYAVCLLKARNSGNYKKANSIRHRFGLSSITG